MTAPAYGFPVLSAVKPAAGRDAGRTVISPAAMPFPLYAVSGAGPTLAKPAIALYCAPGTETGRPAATASRPARATRAASSQPKAGADAVPSRTDDDQSAAVGGGQPGQPGPRYRWTPR